MWFDGLSAAGTYSVGGVFGLTERQHWCLASKSKVTALGPKLALSRKRPVVEFGVNGTDFREIRLVGMTSGHG